jgi:hypothetical protein
MKKSRGFALAFFYFWLKGEKEEVKLDFTAYLPLITHGDTSSC